LVWFQALAKRHSLREIPLDVRTACAAAALPAIHRDPFDRVLVALAQAEQLTILTSDENIAKYPGVKILW
jgi:PIN domain nuclease of toxin-antitoxin system